MLLIDAHCHIYPHYELRAFFMHAFANFAHIEKSCASEQAVKRYLLLTSTASEHSLEQLSATSIPELSLSLSADGSLQVSHPEHGAISLVAGRQIQTRERLEVHALLTQATFQQHLPIEALIQEVIDCGAIAVLPWGVGKWLGARGKLVRELLQRFGSSLLLSDSGLRPAFWPKPKVFHSMNTSPHLVLYGSDPLPIRGEEKRAASYVTALQTSSSDSELTVESLRNLLTQSPNQLPLLLPKGRQSSLTHFISSNIELQRCKHNP